MHLRTPIQTLEGLGEAYRPNVKLMATAGLGGVGEGRGWVHRFKIFRVVWTGVSVGCCQAMRMAIVSLLHVAMLMVATMDGRSSDTAGCPAQFFQAATRN